MREEYNFNISLSVLNHLGRNLYRNVITVIGEAISNSWDADANNVWIEIDREKNIMAVLDDGCGMNDDDFQDKFLKIGYSKRKDGNYKTKSGRPFIGRKGIGKLALLSCAKQIHIATKTENGELLGGIINNADLDKAIDDDKNSEEYILGKLESDYVTELDKVNHGTLIVFEDLSDGIINTIEYIRKQIALCFRFSLIDSNFNIFVNDEIINENELKDFADKTQFMWSINNFKDDFTNSMTELKNASFISSDLNISGYIASVQKPSNIKIRGTKERATIDLFVNGRLREKDILRHIPTSRIVENYVYGQIHFNDMDLGDTKDVFTSSREGVVSSEPIFKSFLDEMQRIFSIILDEWDKLRISNGNDGDPDNNRITPKQRKGQELFNATVSEIEGDSPFIKKDSIVDKWVQELSQDAQFNIPSYADCFVSENLLRHYIEYTKTPLSKEADEEIVKFQNKESANKGKANISYEIRRFNSPLSYLSMDALANLIDKVQKGGGDAGLSRSAITYKPVRDAVGHTALLTDTAKSSLEIDYANIQARLKELLKKLEESK